MVTGTGKLEVFELLAADDTTESYLARLGGDTWLVLRRGRSDAATAAIEQIAELAIGIEARHVVRTFDPADHGLAELRGSVLLEEYVEGDRLESWLVTLAERPLPWYVAAAIVRDAALGAFAIQNACGKVGASELWPGRVAIGFDGTVKVLDPCAELRGTVLSEDARRRYAAPDPAPSASSAVYALGRMLVELRGTDHPPKPYERIVLRATSDDASARYRNPSELAVALDALLDDPTPVEAYFAERFATERAAHAASLAAFADGTKTLETLVVPGASHSDPPGPLDSGSGFTDEVKTAVMPRGSAPKTLEQLPDFEDSGDTVTDSPSASGTDEVRLDTMLGSYAADPDEDIRTRPFRRQLIAKLKRTERVVLGKGAERVAVVSTSVQPARTESRTPDENVIIEPPPSATEIMQRAALVHVDDDDETPLMPPISSEHEEAPLIDTATVDAALAVAAQAPKPAARRFEEPPPNSGATVLIRAVKVPERSRARELFLVFLAAALVAAVAFWVFR